MNRKKKEKLRETYNTLLPQRRNTFKKLKEKIHESLSSVLPITLLVLLLSVTIVPVDLSTMSLFIVGALLLIVGMGLFTLGADMAMLPMGTHLGAYLTKKRNVGLMATVAFALGVLITMAEPDLTVLANQVQGVPNMTLIMAVAVGVGLFLVVALLRILFGLKLFDTLRGRFRNKRPLFICLIRSQSLSFPAARKPLSIRIFYCSITRCLRITKWVRQNASSTSSTEIIPRICWP